MRKALGADMFEDITGPAWVDFGFAALPVKADGTLGDGHTNWFGALQQYFCLEHFKQGSLKHGSAKWRALELGTEDGYDSKLPKVTAAADSAIHAVVISGQLVPTLKAAAQPGGGDPWGPCPDSDLARSYAERLKHYLDLCAKDGTLDKVHSGTAMYRI
jgi:hypothetical protein